MTIIQAPLLTVERLRPRGCRGGAGLVEEGPQLRELSMEEDSVAVDQSVRWRGSNSGGRKSVAGIMWLRWPKGRRGVAASTSIPTLLLARRLYLQVHLLVRTIRRPSPQLTAYCSSD
ncbi:uncharacterized protein [Aegilops tauschii subsp. strangulata]